MADRKPLAIISGALAELPTTDRVAGFALNPFYSSLIGVSGSHTAARAIGTYGFGHGDPLAVTGTGILYPLGIMYLDTVDFPTVGALTPKLRLRVTTAVNDVAPTGNYVYGLYPVTRPATSGGAGLNIYTMGTVVTGSTVTVTAPAADSITNSVGTDFAFPAAGHYVIGMASSAAVAASSHLNMSAILQMKYS